VPVTHVPAHAIHCCPGIYGMTEAEEGGNHWLSGCQVVSNEQKELSPSQRATRGIMGTSMGVPFDSNRPLQTSTKFAPVRLASCVPRFAPKRARFWTHFAPNFNNPWDRGRMNLRTRQPATPVLELDRLPELACRLKNSWRLTVSLRSIHCSSG
jgi:hypothetical protein